jgi:hypothetical protein
MGDNNWGALGHCDFWGNPLLTLRANHSSGNSTEVECFLSSPEHDDMRGILTRHYSKEEEEGHYSRRIHHKLGIIFSKNPNHNLAADWSSYQVRVNALGRKLSVIFYLPPNVSSSLKS